MDAAIAGSVFPFSATCCELPTSCHTSSWLLVARSGLKSPEAETKTCAITAELGCGAPQFHLKGERLRCGNRGIRDNSAAAQFRCVAGTQSGR